MDIFEAIDHMTKQTENCGICIQYDDSGLEHVVVQYIRQKFIVSQNSVHCMDKSVIGRQLNIEQLVVYLYSGKPSNYNVDGPAPFDIVFEYAWLHRDNLLIKYEIDSGHWYQPIIESIGLSVAKKPWFYKNMISYRYTVCIIPDVPKQHVLHIQIPEGVRVY